MEKNKPQFSNDKIKPWQPPMSQTGMRKPKRSHDVYQNEDFAIADDMRGLLNLVCEPGIEDLNTHDADFLSIARQHFQLMLDGFDPYAAKPDAEALALPKPLKVMVRDYCMSLAQFCIQAAKEIEGGENEAKSMYQQKDQAVQSSDNRLLRIDRAIVRAAHYRFHPPKSSERSPRYDGGAEPPWSSMLTYLRRVDIDEDFSAMPASMDERMFSKAWERVFEKGDPGDAGEDLGEQCMKGILAEPGAYDVPEQETQLPQVDAGSGLLELTAPQFDPMDSLGGPNDAEPRYKMVNQKVVPEDTAQGVDEVPQMEPSTDGELEELTQSLKAWQRLLWAMLTLILMTGLILTGLWLAGAMESSAN